jgi:hypothetical protein
MNTETTPIFNDETQEYINLQSATPTIDLTDWECSGTPTSGVCGSLTTSANFVVTAPVANTGYFELEFHLDNVYWNCNFNFGNSPCGVDIRQGIAHMWDRGSFCTNSVIAGVCTALDVPVPTTSGGGLPSPNPCAYDARFAQSGTNCNVGSPGGTAYHLAASTGANGSPWLYAPGSTDLNAADTHLVAANVAAGFDPATSRLTTPVTTNTPTFFIRSDNSPRKQLGESLAGQICYLFTGLYTQPCLPFLNTVEGPITAFPGFTTSKTTVNQNWWLYTAGFSGPTFFDGSLYFGYNSHFVSGITSIQTPTGPCDSTSVPTASAADYQYACVTNYDSLTTQMENSPCLTAPGDPAKGQPNNGPGGHCTTDPTKLSAVSAGIQGEAAFGGNELTIPMWEVTFQFGYQNNGWLRAINSATIGMPNFFTWLNAWNAAPHDAGTLRQGFKETTHSTNPFIGSTVWDSYIIENVYDTLFTANPVNPSQLMDWMTYTVVQQDNATVRAQSGYEPPASTLATYHFTLRNDVFFQDGKPVTAYDVAFSYLNMVGSGAFFGTGASTMSGITVLSPRAFDIGVKAVGPFTLPNLTGIFIVPGRYWTAAGSSTYDTAVAACTGNTACAKAQYALSGPTITCPVGTIAPLHPGCASFAAGTLQIDPNKTTASFDPVTNGILIGSGAWACISASGVRGAACSSSGAQNPPQPGGSYFLTRFGCETVATPGYTAPGNCLPAASSTSAIYFRSSGDLALYNWAQENDVSPIQAVSAVSACFGQAVNPAGTCAHWQAGIGSSATGIVGINQVSAVELRYNLNWISPFEWGSNPPLGIGSVTPILYEGSTTLTPCSPTNPTGYDC